MAAIAAGANSAGLGVAAAHDSRRFQRPAKVSRGRAVNRVKYHFIRTTHGRGDQIQFLRTDDAGADGAQG